MPPVKLTQKPVLKPLGQTEDGHKVCFLSQYFGSQKLTKAQLTCLSSAKTKLK
jgi:hypothetical protein